MLSIALLDSEWDRDDGLVSAPMPDSNVLLKISDDLNEAILSSRYYMKMLATLHGKSADKAYIVMQAPMVEGKLYRFRSLFDSKHSCSLAVSDEHVLYVLECELVGYRMIYDITNYF
jgi:hypothetical protein